MTFRSRHGGFSGVLPLYGEAHVMLCDTGLTVEPIRYGTLQHIHHHLSSEARQPQLGAAWAMAPSTRVIDPPARRGALQFLLSNAPILGIPWSNKTQTMKRRRRIYLGSDRQSDTSIPSAATSPSGEESEDLHAFMG